MTTAASESQNSSKILTGRTERVAACELPHPSEELCEAADEEGHAHHDIRDLNAADAGVVEGQDERGRREGEQATARGGSRVHDQHGIPCLEA